jgi:hypothetical protein
MRNSRRSPNAPKHWFRAEEGDVHKALFPYVQKVEQDQWETFDRFVKLEVMYDPNSPQAVESEEEKRTGLVIENVIASNVDTVTASIAASDVRPRYMTDDGGWSVQRTAKRLEYYSEGLGKLLGINAACQRAFKSCAKKGTGVVKAYVDQFDEVKVEHVRIDDIIVDEAECRNGGTPRQMHRRLTNVDREELKAMFPGEESEAAIDRAQTSRTWDRNWAGYRPITGDHLVVIESHKLPIGRKGKKGYIAGRHTICIDGYDLLDEEWDKPHFPYACIVWEEREAAFYGISLSEGIAGIQRALNKRNLQIDRGLDLGAFPTTYVSMADAHLAIATINRVGTIVPIKGERPKTEMPPAVHPEVYQSRNDLKASASENSGVSRMASQAVKPAGIDSGVAMREYRDQTTQRFAMQEKAFEQLVIDVHWLVIDCCKDLGDKAPVIQRKARYGTQRLDWSRVDMKDVRVQIAAAATLSRTPAGRYQTALEWAQAGVIDTDEFRMLSKLPDLDRVLSIYNQARESVEEDLEAIREGFAVVPEPYGNLKLMVRLGQMAYLSDRRAGDANDDDQAPEEVLEGLRQYVTLAAHYSSPEAPANANAAPMPGEMPMDPAAAGMPMPGAQPVAALAPQAMQLVAG